MTEPSPSSLYQWRASLNIPVISCERLSALRAIEADAKIEWKINGRGSRRARSARVDPTDVSRREEGAGNAGVFDCTRSLVCKWRKHTSVVTTGKPTFPARWMPDQPCGKKGPREARFYPATLPTLRNANFFQESTHFKFETIALLSQIFCRAQDLCRCRTGLDGPALYVRYI